jgi:hypothetical protein
MTASPSTTGSQFGSFPTCMRSSVRKMSRCLRMRRWSPFCGIVIAGDIWRTSFRICPTEKHLEGTGTNLSAHPCDWITYAFEIETSPEQDQGLIRKFINLYQPKALRRSYVADLGISTPEQMAKRLVQFRDSHPELRLSRFIIPQVPGDIARSKAVHSVVESFLKSKKYIVPSGVASPIFAGCVAAVYYGSGGGCLDPAYNAMIFTPGNKPEPPLSAEERRAFTKAFEHLLARARLEASARNSQESWEHVQSKAEPELDEQGRPVLQMNIGPEVVNVGGPLRKRFWPSTPLRNSSRPCSRHGCSQSYRRAVPGRFVTARFVVTRSYYNGR